MKILRLIAIAVLAFAALVLVGPALPGGAIAPRFVQIYETTDSHHFVSVAPLSVAGGGKTIYLDDRRRFQRFKGWARR